MRNSRFAAFDDEDVFVFAPGFHGGEGVPEVVAVPFDENGGGGVGGWGWGFHRVYPRFFVRVGGLGCTDGCFSRELHGKKHVTRGGRLNILRAGYSGSFSGANGFLGM